MTAISDSDDATPGARQAIRDGIDDARAKASETAQIALSRTKDGIGQAREAVVEVYSTSRDKAIEAYAVAREKATVAGQGAGGAIDTYPVVALLGGIAIGAAIGALLPRTERERQALGPIGGRLQQAARDAVDDARTAGSDKLAELGLTPDQARATVRMLLDNVVAAVSSATDAAIVGTAKPAK